MDALWSSFFIVAGVFTAFSGMASVWGRMQRSKREQQQAAWQALLQPEGTLSRPEAAQKPDAPPRRNTLPPDPSFADSPSFVSDSDSRRAALDEALDRMSRQSPHEAAMVANGTSSKAR